MKKTFEILTKKFLVKEYLYNKKSATKISEECNIGYKVILRYLKKFGISIRYPNNSYKKFNYTKKLLKTLYWKHQMSISQIAKKIGCTAQNIWEQMINYNIKRRNESESKKGKMNPMFGKFGTQNHRYIHNLQRKYPIQFNIILKEFIRQRDNYKCQKCGIKQEDCHRKLDNLISLCQKCHQILTNRYYNRKRKIN